MNETAPTELIPKTEQLLKGILQPEVLFVIVLLSLCEFVMLQFPFLTLTPLPIRLLPLVLVPLFVSITEDCDKQELQETTLGYKMLIPALAFCTIYLFLGSLEVDILIQPFWLMAVPTFCLVIPLLTWWFE